MYCELIRLQALPKQSKYFWFFISGNEELNEWIKPSANHLYWKATTHNGNGEVIWAKFSSFFSHVINKRKDLENPVFDKCGHSAKIQTRKWLDKG